jgi:aminoglycoside 2''-phosphotransferase
MQVSDELRIYLEKITAVFPEVTWNQASLITHGWAHDAVILDESLVFRFPKREGAKGQLSREVTLMRYLSRQLTITVPDYTYVPPDVSFAGYEFIPGTPLWEDEFPTLPASEKSRFESDLSDFLTELHATPTHTLHRLEVPDVALGGAAYWEELATTAQVEMTAPGVNQLQERIASFSDELERTGQHDIPVLLHCDLVPPHILSNGGGAITGIIDFSGVRIGDPAVDFQGLWEYGPKTVARIYRAYRGPKDEDLLRRSLCYRVRSALTAWRASHRRRMSTDFLRQREREVEHWLQKEPDQWMSEALG